MNIRSYEKKNGRVWEIIDTTSDINDINNTLSKELTGKYLIKSNWIKSITMDYYYSCDQLQIIVNFGNGYRHVYYIDR